MNNMTVEQMINHICVNGKGLLGEYELRPIIVKMNREFISKMLGVYIDDRGELSHSHIKHDLETTDILVLADKYKVDIENKFGSLDNYYLYSKNHSLFFTHWFHYSGTLNRFNISGDYYLDDLFYFFRYIVNGTLDKDFHEANELLDKYKSQLYSDSNFAYRTSYDVDIVELDIRIRRFQNGRLDIFCRQETMAKIMKAHDLIKEFYTKWQRQLV